MSIRENREMGFVDAMIGGGRRTAALLERLDAATPWETLAEPIAALSEYTNTGPGRPAVMLKCMMLAKWFNLSDPGLEEALMDRISFRKFVDLPFTDSTPDETTFVNFRKRLREAQFHDAIFDAVVQHLDSQGFLERQGTMMDATIIEQSTGRGVADGICYKKNRNQPALYGLQKRFNSTVAHLRARVEHPFAMMKHQLGLRRVRYRGLQCNAFDFAINLAACNLKKSLSLCEP